MSGGQPSTAAGGCGFLMSVVVHGDSALHEQEKELQQRLRRLYPAVNETETPLPRSWSPKDKFSYIGLSQNNLRVHYKGTPWRTPGSPKPPGSRSGLALALLRRYVSLLRLSGELTLARSGELTLTRQLCRLAC